MLEPKSIWSVRWTRQVPGDAAGSSGRWPSLLHGRGVAPSLVGHVPAGNGAGLIEGSTQVQIIGDCRLDNRKELANQLGLTGGLSDLDLILHAYLRWGGDRCVTRLLGAFAFVIHDNSMCSLFCARDPMGEYSLFYYLDRQRAVIANQIRGVLRHTAVPYRPNLRHIAGMTMLSAQLQAPSATYFDGIHLLPPATTLFVSAVQQRSSLYWQPDPQARLAMPQAEMPEALSHLLHQAVAARLPQQAPAIALLSGGLDSSSIVAVAANLLKQQNRQLLTLSAVLPEEGIHGLEDERSFIRCFSSWENIEWLPITAPGRGPFDQVEQLVQIGERALFTSRHYLYTAFAEAAAARGGATVLDGGGGELGPTSMGAGIYPEQLLHVALPSLARELWLRARRDNSPLTTVIRHHLLRPLVPNRLIALAGFQARRPDVAQLLENGILQPAFVAAELGNEWSELLDQLDRMFVVHPDHRRNQARAIRQAQRFFETAGFVGADTVSLTYPFLDKRVLEFSLAAPASLKSRNGYARYLVRTALDGLLPPEIQWRTSKQPFSPDYHLRYNRQRVWAQRFFARIGAGDPIRQIVDVDLLLAMAKPEMAGNRRNVAALRLVPSGVYLITFLRQFPDFSE